MIGDVAASMSTELDARVRRVHRDVVDLHFDLLLDLYERRVGKHEEVGVLGREFWQKLHDGGIGLVGAAIFLDDRYLPELALRVALDQLALLHEEVEHDPRFALCRTGAQIEAARADGRIGFVVTMEGVEPLGSDIHLLRAFYELGVRCVGLTHVRRNLAGDGGLLAPTGSSPQGLSSFGEAVVDACEDLGIVIDLAHLNPAGIEDVLARTHRPPVISHTNPRCFYDAERNSSDEQMLAVAELDGVVGVSSVLLSPSADGATAAAFADQVAYIAELVGIDHVGFGFDFFDFIYRAMLHEERAAFEKHLTAVHLPADLLDHGDAPTVTRLLIERGFSDADLAKVLRENWLRVLGIAEAADEYARSVRR
jgi:membrane dipeptidase